MKMLKALKRVAGAKNTTAKKLRGAMTKAVKGAKMNGPKRKMLSPKLYK